jgi:L-ascorbate 6-phosphate lactonase
MAIHSDWGEWLPRAIEDADPEGVALWYLGCNGFVLKGSGGTTVFIDPYLGTGKPPRTVRMIPIPFDPEDVADADAVFATHEHSDHVDGPSQGPILRTGATYYAPDPSIARTQEEGWIAEYDLSADQFVETLPGESLDVGEFTVHVEEAHDPDAAGPVSLVFEHDAGTFFHGGDTKYHDLFADVGERYDIDLGALAFGSVGPIADKETGEPKRTDWYMDEDELVHTAETLRLERVVPTHHDMWRHLSADPKGLYHHIDGFEYPRRLELATVGDRLSL